MGACASNGKPRLVRREQATRSLTGTGEDAGRAVPAPRKSIWRPADHPEQWQRLSHFSDNYQQLREVTYRSDVGVGMYGSTLLCRQLHGAGAEVLSKGSTSTGYPVVIIKKRLAPSHWRDLGLAHSEVCMLEKLAHPNLVCYYDHWQERTTYKKDFLYISMEHVGGGNLSECVKLQRPKGRPFPKSLVTLWLLQVARAVYYIHTNDILHRNLKSSTIYLAEQQQVVKVGEFGGSKLLSGSTSSVRRHVPPETVLFGEQYTAKSDIWSVGVVMHEVVNLREYQSTARRSSAAHVLQAAWHGQCHWELHALIDELLQSEPVQRPSAESLLQKPLLQQQDADSPPEDGVVLDSREGSRKSAKVPRKEASRPEPLDRASIEAVRKSIGPAAWG